MMVYSTSSHLADVLCEALNNGALLNSGIVTALGLIVIIALAIVPSGINSKSLGFISPTLFKSITIFLLP
jgi:hypothetical protein